MASQATAGTDSNTPSYTGPFITVTALFFIWGFITALNTALVPHLRSIFDLDYAWAMLAESAYYLAYLLFSAPSSWLIQAIGYKWTMVVALFIQVVGCLMFIPAATFVSFPFFMAAVFILGAGVTALQTSVNPYIAILGPESSAPVRLTLAQAFNSIGTTLAPLLAGAYILTDSNELRSKASIAATVRVPYLLLAGALLLLDITVAFMRLPHLMISRQFRAVEDGKGGYSTSIWKYRHTVLGALGIFIAVGVEIALASIAINYFRSEGIGSSKQASFLAALYWFGMLVGRLIGSWLLTRMRTDKLLAWVGMAAAACVVIPMLMHGPIAIWSVVLCGLFNSIMFPAIFALGIAGLGPLTSKASGLMMTAIFGGAVIPYFLGVLVDRAGIQHAFVLPVFCYLFIAYYGLWGYKPVRAVTA